MSGSRLQGYLRIECRADASGRTFLSRQSFRAPIHLSKPHWDGHHLIVNIVNPTAGLFAGDSIELAVRVCAGARVVLTSPSAARVFRATDSVQSTRVVQSIVIERGGRLDLFPEIFIPHGGARYSQTTRIELHAGGELFFTEMMAPGRTASGEAFAYDRLDFATDLVVADRLVLRERYSLPSLDGIMPAWRKRFPNAYYASAFLVSERLGGDALRREVAALSKAPVIAGASYPSAGVCAIKIVAADSISLRSAVARIRALGYAVLGEPEPRLRKL
ncbi:MAG TPA: urease accessory protein UreD [Pirellulaceae bacterium]